MSMGAPRSVAKRKQMALHACSGTSEFAQTLRHALMDWLSKKLCLWTEFVSLSGIL